MYTVRELQSDDMGAWDELIVDSAQGNVFLRSDWLEMLCDTDPALSMLILGCFGSKGELLGGQAVPYVERWGMSTTTEFEFFYSGPVLAQHDRAGRPRQVSRRRETISALAEALSTRLAYIDVEAHPTFRDARSFLYDGWQVDVLYTHLWHMDDPERVRSNMNREKRREIRRAREQYVFAAEQSKAALDAFLPLYGETMRKFSWRPSARWEEIFRERFSWMAARDGCRLYTARTPDGELASGVVVLLSREDQTAYLWRQGSGEEHVRGGVVPALYWHAACDLASELPNTNFGGSPEPSLSRFKDYLGADAVPHFRIRKNLCPVRMAALDGLVRLKDHLYNVVMRVAFEPWQRLRYGDRMTG